MKKIAIFIFAIALTATFTSCHKHCKCVGYIAGQAGDPYRIELNEEEATSCNDLSTVEEIDGVKVGVECK
ncbi:MAG: hypothetical protein J6W84_02225 [Bacteroidales bacterium]|nr:hypothetical protein [Bacteroidales bacterium]MBQ7490369.1 hypothetical protein [Bacteroidales bacterium]